MTVMALTSTPMIGRAADVSAGASPGTGFGDLLSVFGTQPANGGQDAGAPTVPSTDRNAATLGDLFAKTEAAPAVVPELADASVPDAAETSVPVAPSATDQINGSGLPVASASLPAAPVEEGQMESPVDADATAATDACEDAPASPVVPRPRADPTPVLQSAATAEVVTTPLAAPSTDVPVAALPMPNATAGVTATDDAGTPVADAATAPSQTAAGPRARPSRQGGADTLAPTQFAASMTEAVAGADAPAPREAVAGVRSPSQDDRGKAKPSDRASGRDDAQALSPIDQQLMPLATAMTAPVSDQPGPVSAGTTGSDPDDGQSASSSMASPTAPIASFAGAPAQQPQPGQDNLPSLLASQTPTGPIARSSPTIQPYAAAPNLPSQPVIAAQPGRIGRDMGVEIARQVSAGRQEMLVRLDPAEMGRIDVRLSFDDKGHLHAAMSADSPAALDMLRRDAGDLGRALAGAGIQTDASTFRFDSRGGDTGQSAQHQQQGGQRDNMQGRDDGSRRGRNGNNLDTMTASYRQLRTSGRVDLTA